ncbi:MAG TPA: hypothetical protein VM891_03505, partial [Amaricoccus sp.]|nr:hypothetical protein [Amaricoccus sp.]
RFEPLDARRRCLPVSIAPALAEPVAKAVAPGIVETDIPARLDRLPWGRFHNLVIVALASPGSSMGWRSRSPARSPAP